MFQNKISLNHLLLSWPQDRQQSVNVCTFGLKISNICYVQKWGVETVKIVVVNYYIYIFFKCINRSYLSEGDYSCSCLRLSHKACGFAGHRQKRPLDCAVDLLSQFCVSFDFFVLTGKPPGISKIGSMVLQHNYVIFKNYCFDLLWLAGLVNLTCVLEKHVMPTPPLPIHHVTLVWHKVLPSIFLI